MMSNAFRLLWRRMSGCAWTAALPVFWSVVSDGADTEVCIGHAIREARSPVDVDDDTDDVVDSSSESKSESHSSGSLRLRGISLKFFLNQRFSFICGMVIRSAGSGQRMRWTRATRPVLNHGGQW